MDPSTSSAGVGSRFVSSKTLEEAKLKREQDWKAAYERIGQQPPEPQGQDEPYDGRSLYEKLQEQKNKKQEAFDEQLKFKNHFRALDADEIDFLDSLVEDDNEEEKRKQAEIKQELSEFRKAVTSRQAVAPPASLPTSLDSTIAPAPVVAAVKPNVTSKPSTKKQKKTLPGVVVKKKDDKVKPSTSTKRPAGEETSAEAKKVKT
ncbi:hypothetical protein OIO90_004129 [Microbotryomycetes sp. JL221]|nr:hypothetical protein OIO90_004129 [Microbotryomycetes sp. JL221]